MRIRRAVAGDEAELSALAWASKRHWGYDDALMELWRDGLTFSAAYVERTPVFLAVDGGRIDAICALAGAPGTWELEHVWVRPERIGDGVGRTLVTHVLEVARARGARQVTVTSDPNAEGFYLRLGARRVGLVPSVPAGRMLPRLRLDLEPPGA